MAQFSVACRNRRLDAIETELGTSAKVGVFTGAAPANCAAANTGTRTATMDLPADYFSDAAAGVKALLGTWQDAAADASGAPGHYRLYKSDGTTCVVQGTASGPAGGGEMEFDTASFTAGQVVNVTAFGMTEGNA